MLSIPRLSWTTPTLAGAMGSCMLHAGLSRAPGIQTYILGNPRAWLGTAYHEVLEALPALDSAAAESTIVHRAEVRWDEAIARLEREAAAHPLNHRYGSALTWKGYYLVFETLRIRVAEFSEVLRQHSAQETPVRDASSISALREQDLSTHGGKLRGRVDLVRGDEIIDYKTGSLFEPDIVDRPPALKAAYVRQLRIYAYLVHEATGRWPRRGLLYPLAGPPQIVDLESAACEAEAEDAVALLEQYNDVVAAGGDANILASPSPAACQWCPFKTICLAFWTNAKESWAGSLDGDAVAGLLVKPPQTVHDGAAWSIALIAEAGTVAHGEWVISPMNNTVHSEISKLSRGDRVRIVSLGRRSNGALSPTQRTMTISGTDFAALELAGSIQVPEPQ